MARAFVSHTSQPTINQDTILTDDELQRVSAFISLLASTKPGYAKRVCAIVEDNDTDGIQITLSSGSEMDKAQIQNFEHTISMIQSLA